MTYSLFLDDERFPPENTIFVILRDFETAVEFVKENGCPTYISFDHDLATDKTGFDFAKWLINMDLDNPGWISDSFNFYVHSQNPIGRENIQKLLDQYLIYKRNNVWQR